MSHRGPDAAGEWIAPDERVGLGHRRLAIIDLSSAAEQPMTAINGRFCIVFNGEIYNYRELRASLETAGETFRTHSDTEVALALYACYGPAMLSRLRGMFAFAIWDAQRQNLFLARDSFGIKPLYYAFDHDHFRFASQVKALERGGGISLEPDPAGVVGFLLWGSIPEPLTLRRGVLALPAGHHLIIQNGQVGSPRSSDFPAVDASSISDSAGHAVRDSVEAHLVSDVPLAVFLSAGLDSALVASLAAESLGERLTTITVRFKSFLGTPYDEGPLAREIADSLGARHIERTVDVADFPDLWRRAVDAMDQPSIDGFNTYVISQIAHELGFKVVLSGLGGDELFGGYDSFRVVPRLARQVQQLSRIPGLRKRWPQLAARMRPQQPKLAGLLDHGRSLPGAYFLWRGLFLPRELPSLIGSEFAEQGLSEYDPVVAATAHVSSDATGAWRGIQALETRQYMRNQLLRDSDWAAMAHSLELRVPLVDAYLAQSLAVLAFEPAKSNGKASVVRQAAPHLPSTLWDRPKSGFFIPVMDWLAGPSDHASGRSWGRDSRQIAARVLREFLPSKVP